MTAMATYTARISPQVSSGDHCIEIDPPGETEWDATEFLVGRSEARELVSDADDAFGEEVLDISDVLANDLNAPAWVQRHVMDHPFDIYLRRDDLDPTDAPMIYEVVIVRTEIIAFRLAATSAEDAEERYLMDGDEVGSETESIRVDSIALVQ